MLLFLSILGIFLSLILLYFNAREYRSSLYLGLFFLFTSLYGLYQYILLYSKSVTLISIFLFNLSIDSSPVYLIGPMLFFYVRSILTDKSNLKKSDRWHFLPMVIFFISALPNAFLPWQEKVEAARALVEDEGFILQYHATMLSYFIPEVFIYISRLLLILIYTLWSVKIFIDFLRKRKSLQVISGQHFMKKWLCLLLGFMLVLVISQILNVIRAFNMEFSDMYFTLNLMRILSILGLIGLLISPFLFPAILYGLPRLPEKFSGQQPVKSKANKRNDKNRQNFETNYLHSIGQKVDRYMREKQPYLQSDCNLAAFSKMVNIPAHHLAYYFREERKQPFNDFRNEWRVNHAKILIEEGKANEITLEAIGTLSGFSSRNAFINDFKKSEGVSPGVYASRYN